MLINIEHLHKLREFSQPSSSINFLSITEPRTKPHLPQSETDRFPSPSHPPPPFSKVLDVILFKPVFFFHCRGFLNSNPDLIKILLSLGPPRQSRNQFRVFLREINPFRSRKWSYNLRTGGILINSPLSLSSIIAWGQRMRPKVSDESRSSLPKWTFKKTYYTVISVIIHCQVVYLKKLIWLK